MFVQLPDSDLLLWILGSLVLGTLSEDIEDFFAMFPSLWTWLNGLLDYLYSEVVKAWNWIRNRAENLLSWLSTEVGRLWDWAVGVVERSLNWLYSEVDKLWNWVVDTVWKTLQNLEAWAKQIIDYISRTLIDLWAWVEDIYKELLSWVSDLWDGLEGLWKDVLNYTSKIYDSLVAFVTDTRDWIIGEVSGWLDDLEASVVGFINNVKDYFTSWIQNILKWAEDLFNEITVNVEHIFTFLEDAFEDSLTLSKDLLVHTIGKYGVLLFREFAEILGLKATDEQIQELRRLNVKKELESMDEYINIGLQGPWADVSRAIAQADAALTAGEDPPELDVDDSLLPPDERNELKQITDTVDGWFTER